MYVLGAENDISHLTVLDARDISVSLASQHFEIPSSRLRLSGDGHLVAVGEAGKVALYTQDSALLPVATIDLPREDGGFAARPHDMAFNSSGSQLLIATGTTNPRLLIYNIARRKFIAEWNAKNLVNLGSWFNTGVWLDSHQIAVGDGRGQIHILDTQTGRNLLTLDGHTSTVSSLQPLPRGMLLSGGFDRTARMWNLTAGKEVQRWTLDDTVIALAVSASPSRRLFAGDGSGQVVELLDPS